MRVIVKKWGNSAAVRMPAAVMEAAQLHLDDTVDVREEGGRIIIETLRQKFDLEEMVAAITPENMHAAVDFGPAVGRELL
ncbi:AbrB/MazE/SpoVT family DNA-binding domain-containing protein [Acidithiobacillus ferrooxidans]|uniref:PemI family protein n=1 Tax=Acidithiobacillus ferrooxidans (strain ATCC 23270 / DSM 14882 / CIP 104768 / NCIMB 8455) TaxID=243159 RepID=B7J846_ACIF2|nr:MULTISPECIES: AbrB/MazE/SpoVT family DNA-binding domain-containing protein [Acidithiobacillus]ACK80552.1 pemI family protein [Acidithiobacillus ferrooxidans ATCC 23270]MBN6745380.1 AbrB/MazE/SpoVT family DNA-binding domain-containing protein [Acidithiobacillus sp. MC2.2]MBN6748221.1 AbrB/MazE/SpoVT family DNA-binding domain-containing protein [Acidithiobacillus sp. PG05]